MDKYDLAISILLIIIGFVSGLCLGVQMERNMEKNRSSYKNTIEDRLIIEESNEKIQVMIEK